MLNEKAFFHAPQFGYDLFTLLKVQVIYLLFLLFAHPIIYYILFVSFNQHLVGNGICLFAYAVSVTLV